jgi:hypothetical protein
MIRSTKTSMIIALATAALALPVQAEISVSFSPQDSLVLLSAGQTTVDIVADIPPEDAIVGWGIDLDLSGLSASLNSVAINDAQFDAVFAPDGDGLAALVAPADSPLSGQVILATLTFDLNEEGITTLSLSDDNANGDLSEGFALDPPPVGAFAAVSYVDGSIEVIPEPGTLLLLGAGAGMLLRRWRR